MDRLRHSKVRNQSQEIATDDARFRYFTFQRKRNREPRMRAGEFGIGCACARETIRRRIMLAKREPSQSHCGQECSKLRAIRIETERLLQWRDRLARLSEMNQRIAEIAVGLRKIAVQRYGGLIRQNGAGEIATQHVHQAHGQMGSGIVRIERDGPFGGVGTLAQFLFPEMRRNMHLDRLQKHRARKSARALRYSAGQDARLD